MSFRDDHDAAISRIAALEHELARTRDDARQKSERERRRIAMLEREIDELRRGEPSTPRRAQPPSKSPAPSATGPIDELATRGPAISPFLVALVLCFTLGTLLLVGWVLHSSSAPPEPTCTIDTRPVRATVLGHAIDGHVENLGISPVKLRIDQWAKFERLELGWQGYKTITVDAPQTAGACPAAAYDLNQR